MTGGGGSGGGAAGACTNAADQTIIMDPAKMVKEAVTKCGKDNLGMEPATKDCIKMLGLTDPCTTCFDDNVQCVAKNCFLDCAADPAAQKCTDCRAKFCDMAFATCSGLPPNG